MMHQCMQPTNIAIAWNAVGPVLAGLKVALMQQLADQGPALVHTGPAAGGAVQVWLLFQPTAE